jgi:aryl carrier-like protein
LDCWNYLFFHPDIGLELEDRGGGMYELVAVRKPGLELWQPIFSTYPDLQKYAFKDLFSKHPLHPHLYTYEGRADDVVVLSNGEKFQPHTMELAISSHPLVKSALVAGQGRFQICLLIEPSDPWPSDDSHIERYLDSLWPAIAEANKHAPSHARLSRDHIIVARPDIPWSRTSKGTIRRGPTLKLHEHLIDRVYEAADGMPNGAEGVIGEHLTYDEVLDIVRAVVAEFCGTVQLSDEDNLFNVSGLDSLQVVAIDRILRKRLPLSRQDGERQGTRMIYRNPTVAKLSRAIYRAIRSTTKYGTAPNVTEDGEVEMLFARYDSQSRPSIAPRPMIGVRNTSKVVILTGSTGSLGSYLLGSLMEDGSIREIWCLDRSPDAQKLLLKIGSGRGLRTDFESRGVHFRHADLTVPSLGLRPEDMHHLQQHATHILRKMTRDAGHGRFH